MWQNSQLKVYTISAVCGLYTPLIPQLILEKTKMTCAHTSTLVAVHTCLTTGYKGYTHHKCNMHSHWEQSKKQEKKKNMLLLISLQLFVLFSKPKIFPLFSRSHQTFSTASRKHSAQSLKTFTNLTTENTNYLFFQQR